MESKKSESNGWAYVILLAILGAVILLVLYREGYLGFRIVPIEKPRVQVWTPVPPTQSQIYQQQYNEQQAQIYRQAIQLANQFCATVITDADKRVMAEQEGTQGWLDAVANGQNALESCARQLQGVPEPPQGYGVEEFDRIIRLAAKELLDGVTDSRIATLYYQMGQIDKYTSMSKEANAHIKSYSGYMDQAAQSLK